MDQENSLAGYVFVSYVREDSCAVGHMQEALESAGIQVWRDTANLWPGQNWHERIRHAITSNALVFIACFSAASLRRVSNYQNEELTLAIEEIRKRPASVPWIIPVRLDDCEIPDRDIGAGRTLRSIHRADLFGPNASGNLERLVSAVLGILGRHPASGEASLREAVPGPGEHAATQAEFDDVRPTFGIVTALPEEFAAMRSFIENPKRTNIDGDRADYVRGTLPSCDQDGPHPVVLTMLGDTGNDAAASSCANLLRSFRSVRCILMVGIAAGVPDPNRPERHVRLGDIVVARWGIAEYDSVQDRDDGAASRRTFPQPSPLLERRARLLQADEAVGHRPWEELLAAQARVLTEFSRPAESTDVLYASDGSDRQIPHPDVTLSGHRPGQPKVHSGLIGSGDRSLRSARSRDAIAGAHDVLAIEMEGKGIGNAGFYDGVEWFTIRGISDYGDRHVNRLWRNYASLAAAAYACALLAETPPFTGEPPSAAIRTAFRPGPSRQPGSAAMAADPETGRLHQVEALGVRISSSLREPVVVLMDKRRNRFLTVRATPVEAVSITYARNGIQTDRQATRSASYVLPHDLFISTLQVIDVQWVGCEIRSAPNRTLIASLTLSTGHSAVAAPTDAIAIALRAKIPIEIDADLLDFAGTAIPGEQDDGAWQNGFPPREPVGVTELSSPAARLPGTRPATVAGIRSGTDAGQPIVTLAGERDGWSLPVVVSPVEAATIDSAARAVVPRGSCTHLLLCEVLRKANARLLAALVSGHQDGTVHGELVLLGDHKVQARAGDSIALALLSGAPVLTARREH